MWGHKIRRRRRRARGQSLVEFALVVPLFVLIFGAIVQFGLIFWAQNTLTQVVRDTGRWAATQMTKPCDTGGAALVTQADTIARTSSLFDYSAGEWSGTPGAFGSAPATREGVEVSWEGPTGLLSSDCPPDTNQTVWFVNIRGNHEVKLFFPFVGAFLPGCNATSCALSSAVQFRMEPAR